MHNVNSSIANTTNQFANCYVSRPIVSCPHTGGKDYLLLESGLPVNRMSNTISGLAQKVLKTLIRVSIDRPNMACIRVQSNKTAVAKMCGISINDLEHALNELTQFRLLMLRPNTASQSPWINALVCLARLKEYQHG